jgi:hypothetical protein
MGADRIHNEWFMPLAKTTCPCGCKKTSVYAWGEYGRAARWNTVEHFCQDCFRSRVLSRLVSHAAPCGCSFRFQARSGYALPEFIKSAEFMCNVR